jgi:hypothetical protein
MEYEQSRKRNLQASNKVFLSLPRRAAGRIRRRPGVGGLPPDP